MNIIKVSSKSNARNVAAAISGLLKEEDAVEVHSIGAGSLNQAIKGVIIARGFLAPTGVNISITPSFLNVDIAGEEKTAIKLLIESK